MFAANEAVLAAAGMRRIVADATPGYPCRVSLQDAHVGETVILGPYPHHAVAGPYAASGPIFVREAAACAYSSHGQIPPLLRERLLSVRAYDAAGWLHAADVVSGNELEDLIERLSGRRKIDYLHVHNAGPGCYMCRIDLA